MTREEAIAYIKAIKNGLHETGKDFPYRDEIIPVAKEALDMAIKSLEQEPCGNAVSREAVEDAIAETIVNGESLGYAVAWDILSDLPPVTPQPKIGKWIYRKKENSYRCSLCTFPCHKDNLGAIPTKYCAGCGAKMQASPTGAEGSDRR